MKRSIWRLSAILTLVLGGLTVASSYEAMVGPTGVLKYNAEKSYGGYTLFSPMVNSKTTCLIDMEGNMVHRAYRYGSDYPGLKGRDFSKQLPLVENCPQFFKVFNVK